MARTRFEFVCPNARKVYLAGDFNDWAPEARRMRRLHKNEDRFVCTLDLPPGRYEFKYFVDGEWMCCPHAPRVTNDVGSDNSVIEVGE